MKRKIFLVIILAALSAYSGYLMSKASWIGKVGMTFFYREYNLLKIWWQGGAAVFIFIMAMMALHSIIEARLSFWIAKILHVFLLAAAVGALYLTYDDFTTDLSHKWLGRRFHYGFYLIWVEWMLVAVFYLVSARKKKDTTINTDKTAQAVL